jgi:NhaP-type Na+/H+ and K+/H+ antiporter
VGLVWLLFLRFLHSSEHAYPVTLSALLILYVAIDLASGSAAAGILTVAIILGNAPLLGKFIGLKGTIELDTEVRGFHRQMAFIVKSFFFVFIGAMLTPPWSLIGVGVVFGLILLLSRAPAVMLSTWKSELTRPHKTLATIALPRGMAAGVLAALPMAAGIPATDELPVVVFAAVFTTILIFAIGFPIVRRRVPEDGPQESERTDSLGIAQDPANKPLGPSSEVLRKAAIPKAPKTGFEESVLTSESLEPDPRVQHLDGGDDLEVVSSAGESRPGGS